MACCALRLHESLSPPFNDSHIIKVQSSSLYEFKGRLDAMLRRCRYTCQKYHSQQTKHSGASGSSPTCNMPHTAEIVACTCAELCSYPRLSARSRILRESKHVHVQQRIWRAAPVLWGGPGYIQRGNAGGLAVPSGRGEAVPNGLQVLDPRLHQRHISRLPELVVRHRLRMQMKLSLLQHASQYILTDTITMIPCLGKAPLSTNTPPLPLPPRGYVCAHMPAEAVANSEILRRVCTQQRYTSTEA